MSVVDTLPTSHLLYEKASGESPRKNAEALPSDWDVCVLKDLGTFRNGINKDKQCFGHGFPFVNLNDVFEGKSLTSPEELGLVSSTISERKFYNLKKGDVLFVRSSVKPEGVGLSALVLEDIPNAVFSGFLILNSETPRFVFS